MEVAFRITVLNPPSGVTFRLQRGRSELVLPSHESASSIVFDFTLRAELGAAGGRPRLLGPFAQGPPASRFVYVSSGKHAGQLESCWDRRAKVQLGGVDATLIEQAARSGAVIETQIAGTGRDGGPACATVPLVGGWRIASS
ncbi:MAG TPA: DUF5990 family protein [Thermoanaerobaculia bacterium]|jgi:hypothetical protein|nr:DUF5990 family protein [Thermoanaerobaculia bacterium]